MTLSEATKATIKSTAPVLKEHGTNITATMYDIMFRDFPECKNLFNMSHQNKARGIGGVSPQEKALASAVYAYAANIDNLGALTGAIQVITQKHVSFDIMPRHYDIVGTCLIKAIMQVLNLEESNDIIKCWKEGYKFLADLLIEMEANIKKENAKKKGGWSGYKTLVVADKKKESDNITSFYLKNVDGSPMPEFSPGQYLSFVIPKGELKGVDHDVVRNYSLSGGVGKDYFRISVKREEPNGVSSNYFHDHVKVGAKLKVGFPCGSFVLNADTNRPIVLVSAGVGVTPMMCMLESLMEKNKDKKVTFIQCVKSPKVHAMKTVIDEACKKGLCSSHVFYSQSSQGHGLQCSKVHEGRITGDALKEILVKNQYDLKNTDFYVCGPEGFIKSTLLPSLKDLMKVPESQIFYEYFGPNRD